MMNNTGWRSIDEFIGISEGGSGVDSLISQFLLNSDELVVLGQPLGSAGGTSFDLSCGQSHHQISDEIVLGLSWSVGHHDSPSIIPAHFVWLDGLGYGSDLVHFQQKGVAGFFGDCCWDSFLVGDQEIISDYLVVSAQGSGEVGVALPVVLVVGIFNGNNWVFFGVGFVVFLELCTGDMGNLFGQFLIFEVEIVFVCLFVEEFRGSTVQTQLNDIAVSWWLDGWV